MGTRVDLDMDASGVVAGHKAAADSAQKLNFEFKEMQREMRGVERQAKRTWDESRDPLEKYNDQMKKLRTLVDDGRLSKEQFTAAAKKAREELERSGTAGQKAFGANAALSLGKYALGVAGIGSAIQQVTAAFRQLDQERTQLAQGLEGKFPSQAMLASQSPREFDKMLQQSLEMERSGAPDAAKGLFLLDSGDINTEENRQAYARLVRTGVVGQDPAQPFIAASKLRANFGMPVMEALSGLQQTAAESDTDISGIGRAAPKVAARAKALGFKPEAMLAALAELTRELESPDVASTALNSLLVSIEKNPDIRAETLPASISKVRDRMRQGVPLRNMVTDQTGQQAALQLESPDALRESALRIGDAMRARLVETSMQAVEDNPITGPIIAARQARGSRVVARQLAEGLPQLRRQEAAAAAVDRVRNVSVRRSSS